MNKSQKHHPKLKNLDRNYINIQNYSMTKNNSEFEFLLYESLTLTIFCYLTYMSSLLKSTINLSAYEVMYLYTALHNTNNNSSFAYQCTGSIILIQ